MKNLKIFFFFIVLISSGCTHFYKKNEIRNENSEKIQISEKKICIRRGENLEHSLEVDKSVYYYSKLRKNFEKAQLSLDCNKTEIVIVFDLFQKDRLNYFYLSTLGVIPGFFEESYKFKYYVKEIEIKKESLEGTRVLSIFILPFFFLAKSEEDVIYEVIMSNIDSI